MPKVKFFKRNALLIKIKLIRSLYKLIRSMKPEYILCAANWYNDNEQHAHQPINITTGFIIAGHRHHSCITTLSLVGQKNKIYGKEDKKQGFLTNTNRFVTREEGGEIAYKAGQTEDLLKILFSENLY